MLTIKGLDASYGAVRALRSVDLVAPSGEVTAVLGANGAGKTTLLRSLSGMVRAVQGSAIFDGYELIGHTPEEIVRHGVSHVPEGRGVIDELTIEENLRLGGLYRGQPAELRHDIDEVFEFFPPLLSRRAKPAFTLSGGERQMLAIGRAMVARPSLLLLDEPSLGLAPLVTASIMAMIRRLCDERSLTVVLVEQNAKSALSIAHRAVVLSVGEVVVAEAAEKVRNDQQLRHHYLGF
jgi:branched-chain amino acid transport system ATP-binding protein